MRDSSQIHAHRNQAQQRPVSEMFETLRLRGGNAADGRKVFISPGLQWDRRPAQALGLPAVYRMPGAGTLDSCHVHVFGVSVVKSSSSQHDFTLELSEGTFKKSRLHLL